MVNSHAAAVWVHCLANLTACCAFAFQSSALAGLQNIGGGNLVVYRFLNQLQGPLFLQIGKRFRDSTSLLIIPSLVSSSRSDYHAGLPMRESALGLVRDPHE